MRRTVFGVLLLALTVVARAQDYGSGGTYSIDRSSEDYSYLKNPAERTDFFDPIKYMPFSDNPDWYWSLGGQVRDRFDYFNNSNFGAGPRDNGFNLLRMLVNADVHLGPSFRAFLQLDSSIESMRAGGPRAGDADAIDFQQGFVDVTLPIDTASSAVVRLGRQELIYGAQRLISPNDWRNVRQSFDGGKVSFYLPGDTLDLFLVRPVVVNENHLNSSDDSTYFGGVYNVMELPQIIRGGHSKLDLYLLSLNKSQSSTNTADSDTYTIGTRFHTTPAPWDFDVEPDFQFGKFSGTSINAYAIAAEGGYTFSNVTTTPRAAVGIDLASGSANPAHRFNQLFPPYYTYLGHMYLFGRQNIIDLHPGLTFLLTKDVTLTAEQHFFWRQNTNDAVYNLSGGVVRASGGSNKAFIGSEFDLVANWQIQRHISTYAGYAHFFAGPFIQSTSAHNNEDEDFVYAAVTFTF